MEQKAVFDVISLIASITSVILAIGAIWLSVVFYRMSNEASKATTEAAKGIAVSVERLEKLFDKLYSDTFSMMKDTVSDMRKHIWPTDQHEQDNVTEEVESKSEQKIAALKSEMDKQVSEMLQKQKIADDKMSAVRKEMMTLLDRALMSSRQVESEAREETIREHILPILRRKLPNRPSFTVAELLDRMAGMFPIKRVVLELERMRQEGLIASDSRELEPNSLIKIIK